MRAQTILAVLAILAASLPAAAQAKSALLDFKQSEATFTSEGLPIYVELFRPRAESKSPAVIILPGDDLVLTGRYPYVHIAAGLARAGNVALFVRYFDRTDPLATRYWTPAQKFSAWRKVIADAVDYAAVLPEVDANRIGLVGISTGASLALAIATQDARVHAVVDYYGELPDDYASRLRKMPPVLILHGDKDLVVKVDVAYRLEALLRKNQVPCEMKIFPGEGHEFRRAAVADALARAIAFLRQHL
jgi:carboxymethylenebutenolidase